MTNEERREAAFQAWADSKAWVPSGPPMGVKGFVAGWEAALNPPNDAPALHRLAAMILLGEEPPIDLYLEAGLVERAAKQEIERLRGLIVAFKEGLDYPIPDIGWDADGDGDPYCLCCGRDSYDGHKPDCPRVALMAEAEKYRKKE